MPESWRLVGLIAIVLAIPVIPFLILGTQFEQQVSDWVMAETSSLALGTALIAALSVDIVLPVPSSLVSTLAGARLGIIGGTICSWVGMTLGASAAFAIARTWGRSAAERLSGDDWLRRVTRPANRYGSWLLILTRGLPILAEASVLAMGLAGLSWSKFTVAVGLSNLGIAAAYAIFGRMARDANALPAALVASVVVPLTATWLFRTRLQSSEVPPDAKGEL
jgi:uncharacterized membrane protein YdjX (TVP38/TMEM64 family)